jgi:hypothetical protein
MQPTMACRVRTRRARPLRWRQSPLIRGRGALGLAEFRLIGTHRSRFHCQFGTDICVRDGQFKFADVTAYLASRRGASATVRETPAVTADREQGMFELRGRIPPWTGRQSP